MKIVYLIVTNDGSIASYIKTVFMDQRNYQP